MRILNQLNKQILQTNREQPHRAKIEHMANNCYASVIIDGHNVSLVSDSVIENERVIVVEVEGL